jgi:hypothetical protein
MDELKSVLAEWPAADIQKDIAIRIATHAQARRREFSVDPATILIIINCIINVIRLLYVCKTDAGVEGSIRKPGRVEKYLLKRQVKKEFPKHEVEPVYLAMIDVCKTLSQKEVNELLDSTKEK